MKLSVGVVILALIFGTAAGPLQTLSAIPDGALNSISFWQHVGEETVRSFAETGTSLIAVIAAALGLPMVQRRQVAATEKDVNGEQKIVE